MMFLPIDNLPTLLLALPINLLTLLQTALHLLRNTIDLPGSQIAILQAWPILVWALLTRNWFLSWRSWWDRVALALLLAMLDTAVVLWVTFVTAKWLLVLVMLWDEAVLQAAQIALLAFPAWNWNLSWGGW